MAENKVAKQYWPERIEIVADLPKTPAGKVQKFQLRERRRRSATSAESERVSARLKDRVCVVTGAARGIGLAIAERFGREGARLACVDVSARRLEPTVAELVRPKASMRALSRSTSAGATTSTRCSSSIESEFAAPVAVLVNNAVWARFQPLDEIDGETVDRMFACGVDGLIWTMQAAAPQMERRGGGSIINLSLGLRLLIRPRIRSPIPR